MPFNIGISSSNICVNIDCGKELTDFEKNRQNQFSCRYFFCIKCRNRGIPKFGEFVKVKSVAEIFGNIFVSVESFTIPLVIKAPSN